jgi:hypothetical protein
MSNPVYVLVIWIKSIEAILKYNKANYDYGNS